jgi:DNA replication protein DnaC
MTQSTDIAEPVSKSVDETMARLSASLPPEERARRQAQRDAEAARTRQEQIAALLDHANVPKRQRGTRVIAASGWITTLTNVSMKRGSGFLVALVGIRGNGKTQMGVELIRANAESGVKSRFCSAMEFFMEIKAGYRNDSKAEKEVIADFCRPSLLVIDEIGQRSESDWENRLLFEMINRRYNDLKDTLLISNQDETQIKQALGPSIVSRINETGGLIPCTWESFRK